MKITNDMTSRMVNMEIGRRIKKYRLDVNIRQSELSKKSGVSVSTIQRIEKGEDVNISKIIAVLLAFNLASNLDYFVPEEPINPIEINRLGHSRERAAKKRTNMPRIEWDE